jgi:enterochelin esterase-like enzyme
MPAPGTPPAEPSPPAAERGPGPLAPGAPDGTWRLQEFSFTAQKAGRTIPIGVYLPPGYDHGEQRYPVVYHLHGLGGYKQPNNKALVDSIDKAMKANLIGPVIVVFPNAGWSMWVDQKSGNKRMETLVNQDLVPHIDAKYRTIAHRNTRVVSGFSAGGFGAVYYGAKHPDRFSTAVSFDGALVMSTVGGRQDVVGSEWGGDEAYFKLHSPWMYLEQNAEKLRQSVRFSITTGQYSERGRMVRELFEKLKLNLDYTEAKCGHELTCIAAEQGNKIWGYVHRSMAGE